MSSSSNQRAFAAASEPQGIAPWWQAAPFALVFFLFFLVPLGLIAMVSLLNFNEYELIPALTLRNYLSIFEGCSHLTDNGDLLAKAGSSRDGGSYEQRMGGIACWNAVMDENEYMVRKWNEFVAA